jgi:predicted aldo/keto reductase-like oxidoreductase
MEKRILGKTNERISVIGFGGIVVMNETALDSLKYVSKAIERGINYFDVAPQYLNAQERLGTALKPYRKDVFLACKTLERTKKGARRDLLDSLEKLKTDHFDLYQFHAVITPDEVKQILGPGGAMEAFEEAKEEGLVRFIGFSAHTEEAALALLNQYDFSTILFPFNWASWLKDGFGPRVLEEARKSNKGILALKALAKRSLEKNEHPRWGKCWYAPVDDFEEAALSLRFTLSLPVTSAVSPSHSELLWWACDIADNFKPLSEDELGFLREKAKNINTITAELKNI